MQNTREEVIAAVHTAFAESEAAGALAVLDLYGVEPHERERERVQLAIVALSGGNEDQLLYFVQTAKTDYRDVLHWHATGPLTPEQGDQEQQRAARILERWGKK
jgi:threonine dehydratase